MLLGTIVLIHLVKLKKLDHALKLAETYINKFLESYKRHLCPLASTVYFFYSRIFEINGNLKDIRVKLFDFYRTACVKKDEVC